MVKKFLSLEWKAFRRSASFRSKLFIKIISLFAVLYFVAIFLFLGVGAYYGLEEVGMEPFPTVNRFLIIYLGLDLMFRYLLQRLPVMNIRPLLYLNISKNHIAAYGLGKTFFSAFNWVHLFLLLPFTIVLLVEGFDPVGAIFWFLSIFTLIFFNNFLNILSNNRRPLLLSLAVLILGFGALLYYDVFDVTYYTQPWFEAFFQNPFWTLVPLILLALTAYVTFSFYRRKLYLDTGLSVNKKEGRTEEFSWLNRFGTVGTFIKNDIRLIKRNKRSRTTVFMSIFFLFYGLLFFTGGIDMYDGPVWRIFAGIFVSGGFLFTFGQFVPSWDSSYYPLMMTQNIPYRQYLEAKWWLMLVVTFASALIGTLYLYFGWEAYLAVLVGAIYNMGVNAHLVLWSGAYIKTPIDLSQNKNVMGDKQAFNTKTLLLSLPKMVLPLVFYALGHYLFNPAAGYILVAAAGISGFVFKNKVFSIIERIYKTEKYSTIAAYKQDSI